MSLIINDTDVNFATNNFVDNLQKEAYKCSEEKYTIKNQKT